MRGGTSLVVQWLGLRASTAGGMGLIPGQGTKIPYAGCSTAKKKKKKNEGEIMTFTNKQKLREFIPFILALQEVLTGVPQVEMKEP